MQASDEGSQASSAQGQGRDFEAELFAPFGDMLRDGRPIRSILRSAFDAAPIVSEPRQQVVQRLRKSPDAQVILINKEALVSGIIRYGQTPSKSARVASWLVEWLKAEGGNLRQLGAEDPLKRKENLTAFEAGSQILPSRSLRHRVLPRAAAIARQTVNRDQADTRHILFALLEEPAESLHAFGQLLTEERLANLKAWLAERIIEHREPDENVDAWRQIAALDRSPEAVGTLADAPAIVDRLGRKAFSDVLAARIKDVRKTLGPKRRERENRNNDAAFILHLDGPWGSGKSSILNFLRDDLSSSRPQWLVVEFNAWRNQDRKPAWWPLIAHVGQAVRQEGWLTLPKANLTWLWWNITMRLIPLGLTAGVLLLAILYFRSDLTVDWEKWGKAVEALVKGLVGLTTLGGLVWTASRTISIGSKSAAQAYVESTAEPYRPIVRLYERLVRTIGRPVAVFIDDIDRCDSDYVIELLEGIQTLLRSAPVVYVVAGDRNWICSSFEKRYSGFAGDIGHLGRPLGHLFLDKVFQLSTSIPRLSLDRQKEYWRRLLERGDLADADEEFERERARAEQTLKGKVRHEDIQHAINTSKEGLERETLRAAAARQITSAEATKATEHRLEPLAPLLEPNPRAMKRLVNAYGLNQARAYLEAREVAVEALAGWTIVQLRWPRLADYLTANWTDVAGGRLSPSQYPDEIRALLADADVREVFGPTGDKARLTKETLAPILE